MTIAAVPTYEEELVTGLHSVLITRLKGHGPSPEHLTTGALVGLLLCCHSHYGSDEEVSPLLGYATRLILRELGTLMGRDGSCEWVDDILSRDGESIVINHLCSELRALGFKSS